MQSRYYSPKLCRFISADDPGYLGADGTPVSYNLFACCASSQAVVTNINSHRTPLLLGDYDSCSDYYSIIRRTKIPLRDVTEEINNALFYEAQDARRKRDFVNSCIGLPHIVGVINIYCAFYNKVNHGAEWDIKIAESWINTIGTEFPGTGVPVIYDGAVMTPESLGNYSYGYIGHARGIPLPALLVGSYYAAGFPTKEADLRNEMTDWLFIIRGYFAYS